MSGTTFTTVTNLDQLQQGDTVRTSGGTLDYKVVRVSRVIASIIATANDGRTLVRVYTKSDLAKGNLKKVTYN